MARDPKRSRALRQLAEGIVARIPEELLTSTRPDLATSLVRQWQTYDDRATLLLGEEQHYFTAQIDNEDTFKLEHTRVPLRPFLRKCSEDRKLDEDELEEAVRQLNLAQSAVLESRSGDFLRFWVNPKDRKKGIELLGKPETVLPPEQALARLARYQVESILGVDVPPAALEALCASLMRQWTNFDGHALLLTPKEQHHIVMRREPDKVHVTIKAKQYQLARRLRLCGLAPPDIPQFLHAVNIGQAPEVTDTAGRRYRIVTNPRTAYVAVQLVAGPPEGQAIVSGW